MKGPLFLTPYDDNKPVFVDSEIAEKLTPYQIDGVRFLYQQCMLKNQNVILNNDRGMNEEQQICAFLSAIKKPIPSLILCQPHSLSKWYYEFSNANLKIVTANELIQNDSWENSNLPDAIILTHDQSKHIKALPIEEWFFLIIQNLDCLEKSRYINNINSHYRIGILYQNFQDLTNELQWFAMKWANSSSVKDKDQFVNSVHFMKINFLSPFPSYWNRITWETVKKFKPTEENITLYEESIKNWCMKHKPSLLTIPCTTIKKQKHVRKRVSTKRQTNKQLKKRCIPKQIKQKILSSDSEVENNVYKVSTRNIQSSSDSDTQDLLLNNSSSVQPTSPGNNIKINNIILNKTNEQSQSLLDDSKDSCILDSLFDSPEPCTSKYATNVKNEPKSLETNSNELKNMKVKSNVEKNFILDSLIDGPEHTKEKEFRISDDENETCPILDLLF